MSIKKQVRAAFRLAVFLRDRFRCAACGLPGRDRQGGDAHRAAHPHPIALAPLDAHHITDRTLMPNGGYVAENGISVCDTCHALAEQFHQTGTAADGFSIGELYARIGSSFEVAERASAKLG
jgi:5-methylcytosine-specific restriction endonuclease McrA